MRPAEAIRMLNAVPVVEIDFGYVVGVLAAIVENTRSLILYAFFDNGTFHAMTAAAALSSVNYVVTVDGEPAEFAEAISVTVGQTISTNELAILGIVYLDIEGRASITLHPNTTVYIAASNTSLTRVQLLQGAFEYVPVSRHTLQVELPGFSFNFRVLGSCNSLINLFEVYDARFNRTIIRPPGRVNLHSLNLPTQRVAERQIANFLGTQASLSETKLFLNNFEMFTNMFNHLDLTSSLGFVRDFIQRLVQNLQEEHREFVLGFGELLDAVPIPGPDMEDESLGMLMEILTHFRQDFLLLVGKGEEHCTND